MAERARRSQPDPNLYRHVFDDLIPLVLNFPRDFEIISLQSVGKSEGSQGSSCIAFKDCSTSVVILWAASFLMAWTI